MAGTDSVAAYVAEIAKMKAMGGDCFALNVNGWDASYQHFTSEVWDAATSWNNAHPTDKFYLYPSVDMASITDEATFRAISRYKYNDPARLRVDGGVHGNNLPVTQTWQGQQYFGGPTGWKRILDGEATAGYPVFFMPYFAGTPATIVDQYNGANNTSPSDDIIDGLYNFGGLSTGTNTEAGYQQNQALVSAVTPGMDAQVGCSPNFNRHSDAGQFGNRILGNFAGFHAFKKCMENLPTQKPRFVELTTWNDYLEGSYFGGPYAQSQLPATYAGNYFSHDAFRVIGRRYVDAWLSGTGLVGRDLIAIAHRPHGKAVTSTSGANDRVGLPKQGDYASDADQLYALVLLKSAGTVRLTSGTSVQTFSQPAGVSEVSMPFAAGTQKVELLRSNTVELTATSAIQVTTGPVSLFNFNVATAYAEG